MSSVVPGTVEQVLSEKAIANARKESPPIFLQILSIRKIPVSDGIARVRIILSDGKHFMQAMLNTSHNSCVDSVPPLIRPNSVLRITKYTVNKTQNRKIFLLLDFDKDRVVHMDAQIGSPVSYEKEAVDSSSGSTQPAVPPSQPPSQPAKLPAAQIPSKAAASFPEPAPKVLPVEKTQPIAPATFTSPVKSPEQPLDSPICPIASLNPYNNKWAIKVRVIGKSEMRSWNNERGEGKLFSMTLLDSSGEIKCTAFKDVALMFFPLFEVNRVYLIGRATVRMARGGGAAGSSYEIQLERTSYVSQIDQQNAQDSVPTVKFSFSSLRSLLEKEKDSVVDVISIVRECSDCQVITTKAKKQQKKRDLTLIDSSGCSVRLTLWGSLAETFNYAPESDNCVYAFKGVRVGDYGGRSLSSIFSTAIMINPEVREAYELKGWYDSEGALSKIDPIASIMNGSATGSTATNSVASHADGARKPLIQIKDDAVGNESADFFSVTATIAKIKTSQAISYPACPTDRCNKKVFEVGAGGQWKCEKCNQTFDRCNYRYMLTLLINDFSSNLWVTAFDDAGLIIFGGRTAGEMQQLKQSDEGSFERIIHECEHKMAILRIKGKPEFYQGEQKMRYSVVSVQPLSFETECRRIIEVINRYQ